MFCAPSIQSRKNVTNNNRDCPDLNTSGCQRGSKQRVDFEVLKMLREHTARQEAASEKTRPFLKLDISDLRDALPQISGGEIKVLLAYLTRANRAGEAWPSLKTLSKDTGLSPDRISKIRGSLIESGALTAIGRESRNQIGGGRFGSPKFRVSLPSKHRTAKTTYGEDAARPESIPPYGENDGHRTAKTTYEVEPQNYSPREEDGASRQRHFQIRKMPDPRFNQVKEAFVTEFRRRAPDTNAPFDGSDAKMLGRLLARQPQASAETLVSWLISAFASGDAPPLRPNFRLREFASHAEKYADGPLLRAGQRAAPKPADAASAAQIRDLVL
jgi:Helix-turn-helix domain